MTINLYVFTHLFSFLWALYCYFFQAHEMVRSEILQQILNRVITKATTPVNHYIGKRKVCTIKRYALMNTGVLY